LTQINVGAARHVYQGLFIGGALSETSQKGLKVLLRPSVGSRPARRQRIESKTSEVLAR
jgi:hypothetical protein